MVQCSIHGEHEMWGCVCTTITDKKTVMFVVVIKNYFDLLYFIYEKKTKYNA